MSSRRRPRGESYPRNPKDSKIDSEGPPENIEVPSKCSVDKHLHTSMLARLDNVGGTHVSYIKFVRRFSWCVGLPRVHLSNKSKRELNWKEKVKTNNGSTAVGVKLRTRVLRSREKIHDGSHPQSMLLLLSVSYFIKYDNEIVY